MLIEVSSNPGDLIWEPFGGLCTVGVASYLTDRAAYSAEIDGDIFKIATARFIRHSAELFEPESQKNSSAEQINAQADTSF
jgi:DNA modification methylase